MNRPVQILAMSAAALLLAVGCSKDKEGGGSNGSGGGGSSGNGGGLPSVTKLQPSAISRKTDGLWYEGASASPFSGRVVHQEDDQLWEEKFEKGVRTFLRAWDKDGDPVELHAWNADGSPRN